MFQLISPLSPVGAGPGPWTVNAEIYPLWARSVGNSLATVTNWVCNFIVSQFFLTVTRTITSWGTFLGFAVICVLASIFVYLVLPETKDKSLEEVELLFMSKTKREAAQTRLDRAGGGGGRGVSLELDVKPEAEVKEK
ncbi:hypothetical protein RRG08_065853 [Elysia crispata]|uniref:Major facilitator superfamily (MFS) profile domain-containing protein n=1 Tax=Elysia crispata TaxID=231223 RepID=A0AAE0ZBI8_9GAST|nr:hypothetical protein RRG08_065853 [Elysia crispata]